MAVLFVGYFFLEGFDYGVGILAPFLGKDDTERRVIVNSIGPFWDGNEVWLLTAGGATFAAFPHWYATLFSGFYLALFLMLVALILRGVAFEFRSKKPSWGWRNFWDWALCLGSFVPALLWGVALTNLLRGVPIDSRMQYVGGFFDLLSPYTLVGGVAWLFLCVFHGALFLLLKTEGEIRARAGTVARRVGVAAIAAVVLLGVLSYSQTDLFTKVGAGIVFWGAALAVLGTYVLTRMARHGLAFATSGLAITLVTIAIFWGLFPRVMVSSLNPAWSLTVFNTASNPYTLKVMTIIALALVPVVLLYQGWTYWVFRQRVSAKQLEY